MSEVIDFSADQAQSARRARREEQLRAGLPPANTTRWVASRKAAVVAAVNAGVINRSEERL